jgi:hypothetical protein
VEVVSDAARYDADLVRLCQIISRKKSALKAKSIFASASGGAGIINEDAHARSQHKDLIDRVAPNFCQTTSETIAQLYTAAWKPR